MDIDLSQWQSIVPTISVIALILSAVVAYFTYRVSRVRLHSDVHPLLKLSYEFKAEKILLKNIGKGPAINIRLERSQVHYLRENTITEYRISSDQLKTLYPGEENEYLIEPLRPTNGSDGHDSRSVNLYRFVETIGMNKVIGILFDDIYGKSYMARFKLIEVELGKYVANIEKVRTYTAWYRLHDLLSHHGYRVLKKPRELLYMLKKRLN